MVAWHSKELTSTQHIGICSSRCHCIGPARGRILCWQVPFAKIAPHRACFAIAFCRPGTVCSGYALLCPKRVNGWVADDDAARNANVSRSCGRIRRVDRTECNGRHPQSCRLRARHVYLPAGHLLEKQRTKRRSCSNACGGNFLLAEFCPCQPEHSSPAWVAAPPERSRFARPSFAYLSVVCDSCSGSSRHCTS